jgi:hypothetical protein
VDRVVAGDSSDCGIGRSHAAYCWGDNSYYRLGSSSATWPTSGPSKVDADGNIAGLALGYERMCIIDRGGVKCAGRRFTPGSELLTPVAGLHAG